MKRRLRLRVQAVHRSSPGRVDSTLPVGAAGDSFGSHAVFGFGVEVGIRLGRSLVLKQVRIRRLQSDDCFGQVVQTETVGPFPNAGLVLVTDFDHDLRQEDVSAVLLDRVSKDRGPDGSDFKSFFRFCHFPVFPLFPLSIGSTNQYDRTKRWKFKYLSADTCRKAEARANLRVARRERLRTGAVADLNQHQPDFSTGGRVKRPGQDPWHRSSVLISERIEGSRVRIEMSDPDPG